MDISIKIQKKYSTQNIPNKVGFTLLEIILVLLLLGIITAIVGPFLGNILGNFIEARQLSERESQANLALERFVRDVRRADPSAAVAGNGLTLTLTMTSGDVVYSIGEDKLSRNDKVLARYISNESEFREENIGGNYDLIILDLKVMLSSGDYLEFSAGAVSRN